MTVGITAYAAYVPRHRLDRAKIAAAWGSSQPTGEIAVANYDEDALTMAAEAAIAALADDPAGVDGVYFASTSAPYAEKQVAGLLATICDVDRKSQSADFTGSTRAGLSAVTSAAHAVGAGARRRVLVAAADARVAAPESELEGLVGDAAAAVCVGRDDVIATIVATAHVSEEFTHVWRTGEQRFLQSYAGKFSNTYGYIRDVAAVVTDVLAQAGVAPNQVARLALYAPDARAAIDLCKQVGLDPKTQLVSPAVQTIGSAGTADALLGMAAALDTAEPGDWIVLAAYGEGADAILLRATDLLPQRRAATPWQQWLAARTSLASYEKYLKFRRVFPGDDAGEAINNVLEYKELRQDVRLYGSRCLACGTVQYPMARVCIQCRTRDQMAEHRLAKRGNVFTFTIDHLIANLELPLPMAVVDLDGGGRVYLQVTDFLDGEVEIGQPMQLTYRRLHEGGGNHNYYWKARPLR